MTLWQATDAPHGTVEVSGGEGQWETFDASQDYQAAWLANARFRLKREPPPAPAPRVSSHPWMVVRRIDTDPVEAYPFDDEADAREFYDQAQLQWSEVYLCQVIKGPVV